MKITQNNIRKIHATEIKGLDPISIYLEDFKPGKGKITISCWNKTWHSYWGGMGDRTIDKFFLSCDNHYLAKNLSSIRSTVEDYESLGEKIKKYYGDDIDYFLKSEIESMGDEQEEWHCWLRSNGEIMDEVFGEEWWYDIPTKENHEYTYLCRVIDATKEILKKVAL